MKFCEKYGEDKNISMSKLLFVDQNSDLELYLNNDTKFIAIDVQSL